MSPNGDGGNDGKIVDLQKAAAALPDDIWKEELERRGRGYAPHEANIAKVMSKCPLFKGRIAFDTRKYRPVQLAETPAGPAGDWTEAHTATMTVWLINQDIPAKTKSVDTALLAVAVKNRIDPLVQWLDTLEWDGEERLGRWLHIYCGADDTPANSAMGSKWLIGAIARAYKPGCRMDTMLVLEGPQGARKSTLVKVLGGEYASENLPDFHSKDAMLIAGVSWMVEVSELSAIKKSDTEHIKAFISRVVDTFRPPYGRYTVTQPRRCVLIGNLNPNSTGYLQDHTGNRRFWPVAVKNIDIDKLIRDREQILAEAKYCFQRHDAWWLSESETEEIAPIQQERMIEDAWEPKIAQWAETHIGTFTTMDVAQSALEMKPESVSHANTIRIGNILKDLGFIRNRKRNGKRLSWLYSRE